MSGRFSLSNTINPKRQFISRPAPNQSVLGGSSVKLNLTTPMILRVSNAKGSCGGCGK